jgi:serine/threonine protein kinase
MWRGLRVAIKRVVLQAALLKEQENALSNTDTASRGGSTPPRPGVPPALQALLAEAAISQSLSHPNIVATYAADVRPLAAPGQVATMHAEGAVMGSQHLSEQTAEDSPTDWELILVQELCGGSVRSLIDGASPQDLRVVLGLLTQLASALAYMHAQGVVHGDVKPEVSCGSGLAVVVVVVLPVLHCLTWACVLYLEANRRQMRLSRASTCTHLVMAR